MNRDNADRGPNHIGLSLATHLVPRPDQNDAERLIVACAIADQLAIAVLKDVQLQLGVRKKYGVQREEGHLFKAVAH